MVIYKSLEYGGCVHESEHHDVKLKGAVGGVECGEPFLSFFHMQLVVTRLHVEL